MRVLLCFILILSGFYAYPSDRCLPFYGVSKKVVWAQKFQAFRERLSGIGNPDAKVANQLLAKLEKAGTDLDAKILESFIDIYLKTRTVIGPPHINSQPYPLTDLKFWNWNSLTDYFSSSRTIFSLQKELDFEFMERVRILVSYDGKPKSLVEAIKKARAFNDDARIRRFSRAHAYFKSVENANLDQLVESLYFQMLSHYSLDLSKSIASQVSKPYSNLFLKLLKNQNLAKLFLLPPARGIKEFLVDSASDSAWKGYLLEILLQSKIMVSDPRSTNLDSFDRLFIKSKFLVNKNLAENQAKVPEKYQSAFTTFTSRSKMDQNEKTEFDLVRQEWNPIVGAFESKVLKTFDESSIQGMKIKDIPELQSAVTLYFNEQRESGRYAKSRIDEAELLELNSNLKDSAFFIFNFPGLDFKMALIRLFDATNSKTFIEIQFPELVLLGRENGESVFELGRLLSRYVGDQKLFPIFLEKVAKYLKQTQAKGFVYVDADRVGARYYGSYGAEIYRTPEQLNLSPEAKPQWILRFSIEKLIEEFYPNEETTPKFQESFL